MNVPSCPRWYVTTLLVGGGYGLLWTNATALPAWALQAGVIVLGYAFLWCTSGPLVDAVLGWAENERDRRPGGDPTASPDGGQQATPDREADGADDPVTDEDRDEDDSGDEDQVTDEDRDVGTIVGKAENLLLPTFILAEAYTALSVIFAAKGLVRREDIRKNTLYYLAGTMTNFTYSIVVGVVLRIALAAAGLWPLPL